MVWQFVDILKKFTNPNENSFDFFSDRLNHRWTVGIFMTFCLLVVSNQYVGNSISCWVPAQFTSAMTTYTNNVCWISNTYHLPNGTDMKPLPLLERKHIVNYYQWVPFILFTLGIFSYMPLVFWSFVLKKNNLTNLMNGDQLLNPRSIDNLEKNVYNLFLSIKFRNNKITNKPFQSSFLCILYFITKIMYTLNTILQFSILSWIIPNFKFLGLWILNDIFMIGNSIQQDTVFPQITMCDFYTYNMGGNTHNYTVQCVLPINLFNRKIFVFIWFWMILMTILNTISLIYSYGLFNSNIDSVKQYMEFSDDENDNTIKRQVHFDDFVIDFLRQDGILLIKIVNEKTHQNFTKKFILNMFNLYMNQYSFKKKPIHIFK